MVLHMQDAIILLGLILLPVGIILKQNNYNFVIIESTWSGFSASTVWLVPYSIKFVHELQQTL